MRSIMPCPKVITFNSFQFKTWLFARPLEPWLFVSAIDVSKTYKLLANPKTAYIKKRQIMRTSFGDYRAKMEKEEKKFKLGNLQSYQILYKYWYVFCSLKVIILTWIHFSGLLVYELILQLSFSFLYAYETLYKRRHTNLKFFDTNPLSSRFSSNELTTDITKSSTPSAFDVIYGLNPYVKFIATVF